MEQLQESSRQIGSITKLITEIAEQTKLLALNATIESARAGEMGKGFAVVASEVKDLAARTAEATAQITDMIEGIQAESTQAAEGISGIAGLINTVAEQQTLIATTVEEQSATSAEMSRGMVAVAESGQSAARAAETVLAAAAALKEQAARLSTVTGA
jgi:methyl-accepting chemotaxis protein